MIMKKFDDKKYYEVLNYLDVEVPYEHADYFNSCNELKKLNSYNK